MQYIHETIIKDIVDIIGQVKDIKGIEDLIKRNKNGRNMKSIAQASSNLTLTYPCLVSNGLSIEAAGMISKAMERKNAQMLQLLLGAWQSYTLTGNEKFDPITYLKQFHSNLNVDANITVDSVFDTVDKVIKLAESAGMCTDAVTPLTESQMVTYLKESSFIEKTLPDSISENSVGSYKIKSNTKIGGIDVIQERTYHANGLGFGDLDYPRDATGNAYFSNPTRTNHNGGVEYMDSDDDLMQFANNRARLQGQNITNARNANSMHYDANRETRDRDNYNYQRSQRQSTQKQYTDVTDADERNQKFAYNQSKERREQDRNAREIEKNNRDARSASIKDLQMQQQTTQGSIAQLQNVDVKKANELVGTPIMVTVHVCNDKGSIDPISFLIAVKSKMYPLDSKDIVQRIITKNKDRNFFGKLIKVATGEISFVRDFLFAIDQVKLDSLSQSRKGSSSKMWRVLERMALKSKVTRALGKNNDYLAITTLVISQEEVEYIKKYANMNMEQEGLARSILDAYNLLCLVIVDETNETAKFIFNTGQDLFEELSFNQLEREASDGSYRKMVNLISKIK